MFKTIKNALKTPEVRKKLLYTLLLIVIFRVGCYITIPGVDTFTLTEQMNNATNGVTGLIDTISGGAFSRLSIFEMSITFPNFPRNRTTLLFLHKTDIRLFYYVNQIFFPLFCG